MVYIENIATSQQVYIPRQVVNTGSSTNGGCINLEDYYTREEVDAHISGTTTDVTKAYVDEQDAATLQSAKDYTDLSLSDLDAHIAELIEIAVGYETQRAEGVENALKRRIDNLFDYRTNTLYLINEENTDYKWQTL